MKKAIKKKYYAWLIKESSFNPGIKDDLIDYCLTYNEHPKTVITEAVVEYEKSHPTNQINREFIESAIADKLTKEKIDNLNNEEIRNA